MKKVPIGSFTIINSQVQFKEVITITRQNPNGETKTETEVNYQTVDKYIDDRQYDAKVITSEMKEIISTGDFRYVSLFGFRQKARQEQNRKMKNELISLINNMLKAEDKKELTNIYDQIMKILQNYESLYYSTENKTKLRNILEISGYDRYGSSYTRGGASKEKINEELKKAKNFREILYDYLNAAYSHLNAKLTAIEKNNELRKEMNKEEMPYAQSSSSKEQEEYIQRRKKALDEVDNVQRELEIKKRQLSEMHQKLEELKSQLIRNDMDAMSLHQLVERKREVLEWDRELNASVPRKKIVTEYAQGTDDEREAIKNQKSEIEKEIERIKKEIKELELEIERIRQKLNQKKKIASLIKDEEAKTVLEGAESRFYGMSKLQQAMAVLSGEKRQLDEAEELGDNITDEQIGTVRGMFK